MEYKKLLIGFLFFFFKFHTPILSLSFDIIGCILVFSSLINLEVYSNNFIKAKKLLIYPLILSLATFFTPNIRLLRSTSLFVPSLRNIILLLFTLSVPVLNFLIYFFIFKGISDHCILSNNRSFHNYIQLVFILFSLVYVIYYLTLILRLSISVFFYFIFILVKLLLVSTIFKASITL